MLVGVHHHGDDKGTPYSDAIQSRTVLTLNSGELEQQHLIQRVRNAREVAPYCKPLQATLHCDLSQLCC